MKKVSLPQFVSMGINKETNSVSQQYLDIISKETGYEPGMTVATAKDLGAEIHNEDPTNFTYPDATKITKLTHEQDIILVHKVQHPEIYGQDVSDMAMDILCRVYAKHAKYTVVKCGLRGTLVNDDGSASSICCEDAESEALLEMVSVIRNFKISCGFKLITIIDRRANFHLKDCIREGKFIDNHKMGRKEQAIVKYLTQNPERRHDFMQISVDTGISESFVIEFMRRTNGKRVTDQSLENLLDGAEKQAHEKGESNVTVDFVNENWQVADNNTENEALVNRMMATLKLITENALTDEEKALILRTVAGEEKKSKVAKELHIGNSKANTIIEEGLGKIKLFMELYHYDAETVDHLLSA